MNEDFKIKTEGGTAFVETVQPDQGPKHLEGGDLSGRSDLTPGAKTVQITPERVELHTNGPGVVQTYNGGQGAPLSQTIQNKFGSPASIKDALENPSEFTIQIGGQRCTLETAYKAGLVQPGQFEVKETPAASEASDTSDNRMDTTPIASKEGQMLIDLGRSYGPGFDQKLAAAFSHVADGTTSEAAIAELGAHLGHQNKDVTVSTVNALAQSLLETAADRLNAQYGEAGEAALSFVIENGSHRTKASVLHRLAIGDKSVLKEVYLRGSRKDRS